MILFLQKTSKLSILFLLTSILFLSSCKTKVPNTSTPDKSVTTVNASKKAETKTLQTIVFGSCNDQTKPQPLWKDILAYNPDLWIWLGDNIYGDSEDAEFMKKQYNLQSKVSDYEKLVAYSSIVGIWDDHDYGLNNGGKEYAAKESNKKLMLDFLDVPSNAPVRKREGAFQSYSFGEVGKEVKVILLDSRYFRDTPDFERGRGYEPNLEGTILGEAQWTWLENELQNSTAQIHLIANGIQVIPEDHRFEKWANFPNERQRMFDLIKDTKAKGVILLSGDRHIGEVSKLDIEGMDYPLYEFTSSGLTHAYTNFTSEENRHRVGEVASELNFGVLQINWSENIEVKAMMRGLNNKEINTFTWTY